MIGETGWAANRKAGELPKWVWVIAVLAVVAGGIIGCNLVKVGDVITQINDNEQKLKDLQSEIEMLSDNDVSILYERMDLQEVKLDTIKAEVEMMQFQVLLLQNAIIYLNPKVDTFLSYKIAHLVSWTSDSYGIDPFLVLALMRHESNFNPKALSKACVQTEGARHCGARGLMQVMTFWCDDYGIRHKDLWNIEINVDTGTGILDDCLHTHNHDMAHALGCYHGSGPNGKYAATVEATYKKLLGEFDEDRRLWNIEEQQALFPAGYHSATERSGSTVSAD